MAALDIKIRLSETPVTFSRNLRNGGRFLKPHVQVPAY